MSHGGTGKTEGSAGEFFPKGMLRCLRFSVVLISVLSALTVLSAAQRPTLAPYISTPQDVVDRMLEDA